MSTSTRSTRKREYLHLVRTYSESNLIEINFYFAICGLPIMLLITTYTGELWLIFE